MNKNEIIQWLDSHDICKYVVNPDLSVDVHGDVDLSHRQLTHLPINFGVVEGWFDISHNALVTLKGCARKVHNHFSCDYNRLDTLEHGPAWVGQGYNCGNNLLRNLYHTPKDIFSFFIAMNNELQSLQGCPQSIEYSAVFESNPLISLEGIGKVGHLNVMNTLLEFADLDVPFFDIWYSHQTQPPIPVLALRYIPHPNDGQGATHLPDYIELSHQEYVHFLGKMRLNERLSSHHQGDGCVQHTVKI